MWLWPRAMAGTEVLEPELPLPCKLLIITTYRLYIIIKVKVVIINGTNLSLKIINHNNE